MAAPEDVRNTDRYRSSEAEALHKAIVTYGLYQRNLADAELHLGNVREKLAAALASNPQALLEKSQRRYTHIIDMLRLPYAPDVVSKRDPALSDKIALDGANALIDAYQTATKEKILSLAEFGEIFTARSESGLNPLHCAILSGNTEIYTKVKATLQKLREQKAITPTQYGEQFSMPLNFTGITPLQDAASSGNSDLFGDVLREMGRVLTPEEMQTQLTHRSYENRNLYHCVTKPDEARETPKRACVDRLNQAFITAFGMLDAKLNKSLLMKEHSNDGFVPLHHTNPPWLRKLLLRNSAFDKDSFGDGTPGAAR